MLQTIESRHWTGAPHGKGVPGLQGPSLYLALGILIAFPLYLLLWHGLWKLTGSPLVRTQASWFAVLAALICGTLVFLIRRDSKERRVWAIAAVAAFAFLSSLTFYVTDFLFGNEQVVSTHFVERKSPPRFDRRNTQLRHEATLGARHDRKSTLMMKETDYNKIVAGDSCITLIERRGTLHCFAIDVRVESSGDGTGHWMQHNENRRRCLSAP